MHSHGLDVSLSLRVLQNVDRPALRDLALEDDHFGRCPIVKAEGYRNFVLCALKQVRVLDGAEIAGRDRPVPIFF